MPRQADDERRYRMERARRTPWAPEYQCSQALRWRRLGYGLAAFAIGAGVGAWWG